jgi:acetyl/propionyl-CoA carboxylase alpha subunit/acetyl-CoA carboxylase carboxyltransferase component
MRAYRRLGESGSAPPASRSGTPIRIAVVQRGEGALRFVHAVREYNYEHGTALSTIVLFSDGDRDAAAVQAADESYRVGPATGETAATRPDGRRDLSRDLLLQALLATRSDLVWAGARLSREQATFARLFEELGVGNIGPRSDVIQLLSDPIEAKRLAESLGIDVAPEPATAGSRRVEVQIAADGAGGVRTLGLRDSSVQRRRRTVIEESCAYALRDDERARLRDAAERLIRASELSGLGTVEFLFDEQTRTAWFAGVDTQDQGEHTVTELATGIDLIKLQLDIALGHPLSTLGVVESAYAVEARITAEDPFDDFRRTPGRVVLCRPPAGAGVRIDLGVSEGECVGDEPGLLLARVIGYGASRSEALARLRRALADTRIVLDGGATNSGFLAQLTEHPDLRAGCVDIGWLERIIASNGGLASDDRPTALVVAAVEYAEVARAADRAHLISTGARGRPVLRATDGYTVELSERGHVHRFKVARTADATFVVETADGPVVIGITTQSAIERVVSCAGRRLPAAVVHSGAGVQVDLAGTSFSTCSEQAGLVRAPSTSLVVAVDVEIGDHVEPGQVLAVFEAMKMENALVATAAGIVRDVFVSVNHQVDAGDPIVRVEPADTPSRSPARSAVSFATIADAPAPLDALTVLRRRLLGFDTGPVPQDSLRLEHDTAREAEIIDLFADCAYFNSRRRAATTPGTYSLGAREWLFTFLRSPGRSRELLPQSFIDRLQATLERCGAIGIEPGAGLDEAVYRLCRAVQSLPEIEPVIGRILRRWLRDPGGVRSALGAEGLGLLERLTDAVDTGFAAIADAAGTVAHELYVRPAIQDTVLDAAREARDDVEEMLAGRGQIPNRLVFNLTDVPTLLWKLAPSVPAEREGAVLELLLRRTYRGLGLKHLRVGAGFVSAARVVDEEATVVLAVLGPPDRWRHQLAELDVPTGSGCVLEAFVPAESGTPEAAERCLRAIPTELWQRLGLRRVNATVWTADGAKVISARADGDVIVQETPPSGLHPASAERLELWRLGAFDINHLRRSGELYLLDVTAKENTADRRLIVLGSVAALPSSPPPGSVSPLELAVLDGLALIRGRLARLPSAARPLTNSVILFVEGEWVIGNEALRRLAHRVAGEAKGIGLEHIALQVQAGRGAGASERRLIQLSALSGTGVDLSESPPSLEQIQPLSAREQRIKRLSRRGLRDPYEIVELLVSSHMIPAGLPQGRFREHDLGADGRLHETDRPRGENTAGIVVGVIENMTDKHREGMARVILLSDPSRDLGALAEPECRRVVAALALAERLRMPVEWFTVSAGARISMTSGTENMDWVARVLRAIVGFTQRNGELNVIVCGVNVGAQPYFNAEATMLMHTRGILVMLAEGSMLLTGKEALEFAGGVSAEDNLGIGGHDRVMGPNGQSQYWAPTLETACEILLRHYEHTYVAAGERFPRARRTRDPVDRDVCESPHPRVGANGFRKIGDIFSATHNPKRKRPFDMRALMRAVADLDADPLERWAATAGGEGAIIWDTHLGGWPVLLAGIESRPLPRSGFIPADGPESWTAGTLFPQSSKKLARAINAASGNRPVVVLANLSGFDGSPESLRNLQLEYGAEIGRAVVNFEGPLVFCVVSRYHGGAFVVFSKALNDGLTALAVEGSAASVIGGAAAAAVVFGKEVAKRVGRDERVRRSGAGGEEASSDQLASQLERERATEETRARVRAEVADEFDRIHSIDRALAVGSIDQIIAPRALRPTLINAVRDAVARTNKQSSLSPVGG